MNYCANNKYKAVENNSQADRRRWSVLLLKSSTHKHLSYFVRVCMIRAETLLEARSLGKGLSNIKKMEIVSVSKMSDENEQSVLRLNYIINKYICKICYATVLLTWINLPNM